MNERPGVTEGFLWGLLVGVTLVLPVWAVIFVLVDWWTS